MRLFRGSAPLLTVTHPTRTDYVLPGRFSSLAAGNDVVQGRFLGRHLAPAILTRKVVPG